MTNKGFTVKIGNTNFIVCVKQSENSEKSVDKLFHDVCKHEILGDFSLDVLNSEKI